MVHILLKTTKKEFTVRTYLGYSWCKFTVTVVAFPPKKGPLKDSFQLINGILPITVLLQNQKLPSIYKPKSNLDTPKEQTDTKNYKIGSKSKTGHHHRFPVKEGGRKKSRK